jgi:hypothetical protein
MGDIPLFKGTLISITNTLQCICGFNLSRFFGVQEAESGVE